MNLHQLPGTKGRIRCLLRYVGIIDGDIVVQQVINWWQSDIRNREESG